jgi:hypothetical protein
VYNQAGYPLTDKRDGNEGLVSNIRDIGIRNEKFHYHINGSGYMPRPGDLAIHKEGGQSHVNIVTSVATSDAPGAGNNLNAIKLTLLGGNQATYNFNTSRVTEYTVQGINSDGLSGFVSPD